MWDLVSRALLNPIDYSGALRTHQLSFLERINEGDDVHTFVFEKPAAANWKAGQHAVFHMPGRDISGQTWRPFSVASSPHEGVVKIGTIVPDPASDFKQHLMQLSPGEQITMHGPFGELHGAKNAPQHIIGIAGGIGITPFRALAYDIAHGYLPQTELTLLYASDKTYTYESSLNEWEAKSDENLQVLYRETPDEVNSTLREQFHRYGNDADYYIAGSPGMISAIRDTCQELGVQTIVNDPFKGYG